jgi:hypothetical protein
MFQQPFPTLSLRTLVCACALTAFTSVPSAFGQSSLASIRGLVSDSQHAAIAGAIVTAQDKGTGQRTTVRTNDSGLYSLTQLPIGMWSLTVEHPGFRTFVQDGITLSTGDLLGINIVLEVGVVAEKVTVTAEAPLIQSRTSDLGQLVNSESVENLPLGDRQTLNVVKITGAAVFASYGKSASATPNYSLAGGRSQSQMTWIDGGSAQNMRLGVPQVDEDPPVESIEEVKILSNNYAAEYGGSAAGVVIMSTKSGTNLFHGSLYEYVRNDLFDAPGFFAPIQNGSKTAPTLRYNLFGGTISGPVRHDKTFFFFNTDNSLRREGQISTLTVPTALQAAGNFSQTFNAKGQLIPIYDPSTTTGTGAAALRQQFPGNVIPASQLDPVGLNLMKYYPLPNRAPDNPSGANNFRSNWVLGTIHYNITAKTDHNFNDSNKLTLRYIYNHDSNDNTSFYPDPGADPTTYLLNTVAFYYGAWTHIVNPTQVNDLRFTVDDRVNHVLSNGVGKNYPDKLGIKGVPENSFPQFAPAGFSALGTTSQERRQYPIQVYQLVDNYSWVRGRHALKFGGEARLSRNHEVNLNQASGTFGFATTPTGLPGNATTGVGLASMLIGFDTSFGEQLTQELDRRTWYLAGFAQDDWTINDHLTFNFGVRWETDTPIFDVNNRMNGMDLHQINPVSGTPGVVKFLGLNGWPDRPYNTDWNNFAPRFGFAWKPFKNTHTVIRGGAGIFYSHPFDSGQPASANLGFSLSASLSTPDNGLTAPFYLRNGVPAGTAPVAPVLNDPFGAVKVGQAANTAVTLFDPTRRTGYAEQFNLGIQRELPGSLLIEVSAVGNVARKLPGSNLPIDQIPTSILGPNASTQAARPYPQFNGVSLLAPTLGISDYIGGVIRVEKRFGKGLSLLSTYTYSKYLENTNDGGATLGADGGPYSDYYNRKADYGPSGNDIRHRFTFGSVYQIPFGKGRHWLSHSPLRYVVGDWGLGSLVNLQTGAPFTVLTQTNNTNSFSSGAQRADLVGDPNSVPHTVSEWFNTNAFAQPAIYHFGNSGMGILRGPGLVNFDFSLLRDFHIRERARLQFRGEFFNAFNHTNLSLPASTFGAAGFGVITASGPARQIQLGARMTF